MPRVTVFGDGNQPDRGTGAAHGFLGLADRARAVRCEAARECPCPFLTMRAYVSDGQLTGSQLERRERENCKDQAGKADQVYAVRPSFEAAQVGIAADGNVGEQAAGA